MTRDMRPIVDELDPTPISSKRVTPKAKSKYEKVMRELEEIDRITSNDEERRRARRKKARDARRKNRR